MSKVVSKTNALSVDVEDYFQVAAFKDVVDRKDWGQMTSRVERNTDRVLALFGLHGVKATFFVLGWIAEKFPSLIQRIVEQGHELACHGFGHQLIYEQNRNEFRSETIRAKAVLEDISGASVLGYRAASYSITEQSKWAIDVLIEAGFEYDSSIVPVKHDLYGFSGAPAFPYRLSVEGIGEIKEFPPSTLQLPGFRLPVGGGGYFRLFPYTFSRWALNRLNVVQDRAFVFYLHPWEIDEGQPRIAASWKSRFRHYNNIERCEARLNRLLGDFQFTTVRDSLAEHSLPTVAFPFDSERAKKRES